MYVGWNRIREGPAGETRGTPPPAEPPGRQVLHVEEERRRVAAGRHLALTLLGDFALPLGLWLAARRRSLGALLVYGWVVAIALTYSRGGIAVAVVVVAAWLALSGFWLQGLATLVAAGLPAAAVIGLASSDRKSTRLNSSH